MNKRVKGAALGIPAGVGFGATISMLITAAGAAFLSYLIATEKVGEGVVGYSAMVIIAIAAAVGALLASGVVKRLRLQVCLLSGVGYYLLLLAMTALFFGGQYQGMGVTALIILIGSALTAFVPTNKGQLFKRRKVAYR